MRSVLIVMLAPLCVAAARRQETSSSSRPGEPRPLTRHMSLWVCGVLDSMDLDIRAPPGFAYMGRSLRSGGSGVAEAIGVSHFKGNWLGGWSQTGTTRERLRGTTWIPRWDHPRPAGRLLLGWLLDGQHESPVSGADGVCESAGRARGR